MTDDPEIAPLDPVGVEPQQPALNFRKRLEELGQMALLVFILASAAFLSAITAMRIAIHGREVTMPNLTGKNVVEATSMLRSRGLVLRVADRIYSELPINVVVRQTPPAGLLMKESQQAHEVLIQTPRPGTGAATPRVDVLISQGPREVAYVMPHFVGMSLHDAQRRLDASRLRRKI